MVGEEQQRYGPTQANRDQPGREIDSRLETGPSYFQLFLVAILVTALFMGPIALLWQLVPTGPWQLMPTLALLIAFESVLTRRWLDWPTHRRDRPLYSMAELAFLLVLTPFFLWLASGSLPVPASISAAVADPLSLFTLELGLHMLLVVLAWERAHSWSGLFIALSITPHEVKYHTTTSSERSGDRSIVLPLTQRSALLQIFVKGWIAGGILLVVCSALATFDVRTAAGLTSEPGGLRSVTRLGMSQEILMALMVYFIGGLVLISQARLVILNGRWLANRSRQDPGMASKWRRWTVVLLAGLALFASFLPIGESIALQRIMQAIAGLVATAVGLVLAIVAGAFTLILLLIYAILSLFPNSTAAPPPPVDFGDLLPPDQLPVETGNPQALLAGSAFWLAITALAILATLYFLRDRGPSVDLDDLRRLWQRLKLWLIAIWSDTVRKTAALPPRFPWRNRRASDGQGRLSRFNFIRVNALSPKEQIRFLYVSLVTQTGKRGLQREPAATPSEFAQDLISRWPNSEADIETLTEAFLEARYSRRRLDRGHLKAARDAWLRIRRVLGGRSGEDSS